MAELVEPITLEPERKTRQPSDGIGICVSGGGYRATLFHVGAFRRLFEVWPAAEGGPHRAADQLGYAISDTAMRKHFGQKNIPPATFPYPCGV